MAKVQREAELSGHPTSDNLPGDINTRPQKTGWPCTPSSWNLRSGRLSHKPSLQKGSAPKLQLAPVLRPVRLSIPVLLEMSLARPSIE